MQRLSAIIRIYLNKFILALYNSFVQTESESISKV